MSHSTVDTLIETLEKDEPLFWTWLILLVHIIVTGLLVARIIMSNRSVGATLSWISVMFLLPAFGPIIYLLIGELRLGSKRETLVKGLRGATRRRYHALDRPDLRVDWHGPHEDCEMIARAGHRMFDVPALPGNRFVLYSDWQTVFDKLIDDINSAKVNCDLEFYIWHYAGRVLEVAEALERAASRGVVCRLLLDDMGSRRFLRSPEAKRMHQAGVQIQAALPGGLWRMLFVRFDLRLHRKIVLIDDQIAWTGSLNLVDPRYFKKEANVGQWIDAMVRIEGPAVESLAVTFQADWYVETDSKGPDLPDVTGDQPVRKKGSTIIQALPSGPAYRVEAIERLLITAIYTAKRELIITTPYFVPSEALQMALASAAIRGVKVIVILPAKVDSLLVRWASQAFKNELMQSGVFIAKFSGGLLHTKSVTIDGNVSLFGSLNMDPRSFRLNFEITLAVYDSQFTSNLRQLQQSYLDQSEIIDATQWSKRPFLTTFGERVARLMGPLL
jgi:cardiolipin synthase